MGNTGNLRDFFGGLFKKQKRNLGDTSGVDVLFIRDTDQISAEQALEVPAFAACLEFVTGTAAGIEFKLYREDEKGVEEVSGDMRTRLLNDDTRDFLSGYELKRALIRDYFLYGGGYAYVKREGNETRKLVYVPHMAVSVLKGPSVLNKEAEIRVEGQGFREFEFIKLLRNTEDGVSGKGMLVENALPLIAAYNTALYEKKLMRTGGQKKGFLSTANRLRAEELRDLKEGFQAMYNNEKDAVIVLNAGVKFENSSNTAVELQMNEKKDRFFTEICSLFGIQQNAFAGKATEQETLNTIKTAVMPVIAAFEAELNKSYLLEREKDEGYYWAADTKTLLRADMKSRYTAYEAAVRAGWLSKNEIRYAEDYPRLPGLDVVSMSLGDIIFDIETKKFFTPNLNAMTSLTKGQGRTDTAE